jgi:hypothetical protein
VYSTHQDNETGESYFRNSGKVIKEILSIDHTVNERKMGGSKNISVISRPALSVEGLKYYSEEKVINP